MLACWRQYEDLQEVALFQKVPVRVVDQATRGQHGAEPGYHVPFQGDIRAGSDGDRRWSVQYRESAP